MSRAFTWWLRLTYPFHSVGENFWAHYSCDIRRPMVRSMQIGNSVWLDRDVWLNIPFPPEHDSPVIIFEDGCKVGRRCMICAKNKIHVGKNVIFGPSVLVMDHNHAFEDIDVPIGAQGITEGGTIVIEEGCWIGFGAVIVCSQGEIVIGRNSVIGANSVVGRSVPPCSVVSGNPARTVKQFNPSKGQWALGSASSSTQPSNHQPDPTRLIESR